WDRLWWHWQQQHSATDFSTFMTTLKGSADWLTDPALNVLPPFSINAAATIDLPSTFDVDYAHPPGAAAVAVSTPSYGSVAARARFSAPHRTRVSTRVKGINRLKIPGSFDVVLRAGNHEVGRRAFFQSTSSSTCKTCQKTGIVNFDFVHDLDDLRHGELSVAIELNVAHTDGYKGNMPLSTVGDPTVNVRVLLDQP
ncbi:unnamed protein product, partial [Laminaria digitata]